MLANRMALYAAEARRFATRLLALGRLGRPRDIANVIVYLASGEAAWVTGTALIVDGSLTSRSGVAR